jgi:hypothetical protein
MQTDELISMLSETPELFLDEIHDWILVNLDIGLSKSAIHELLEDHGFTYKYLRKVASERDNALRAQWMAEMKEQFVAEQLVFVDESSKDDRTIFRRWGRAPEGRQAEHPANFVRGQRYSIVAALSLDGYVATEVVEGSVDGPTFIEFITEKVVCFQMHLIIMLC